MKVTKEMVDRFLSWKLPEHFYPDNGITFTRERHYLTGKTIIDVDDPSWPVGTNLFTADQAREMLEHVLALPDGAAQAPAQSSLPAGVAVVPVEVIKFLLGECSLDGLWFGDSDTKKPKERYWWRKHLRKAIGSAK